MGSALWFAGTRAIIHVTAADSGGRLGVWESEEPYGIALPLHVHALEDEQMVILEGEVSVRVGEEAHRLVGGDTLVQGARGGVMSSCFSTALVAVDRRPRCPASMPVN